MLQQQPQLVQQTKKEIKEIKDTKDSVIPKEITLESIPDDNIKESVQETITEIVVETTLNPATNEINESRQETITQIFYEIERSHQEEYSSEEQDSTLFAPGVHHR